MARMISGSPGLASGANPSMIPTSARRPSSSLAATLVCLALAACGAPAEPGSGFWSAVTPYKVEVVQGNAVTREQAALVKPGLSRTEVRAILGSPLLTDVFHTDRWDYVFSIRRQGAAPQQRLVTVRFQGDRVSAFEAADLPSESDFVTSIAATRPVKEPKLEMTPDELKALPVPAPAAAAPTAAKGAARTYPPLESAPAK